MAPDADTRRRGKTTFGPFENVAGLFRSLLITLAGGLFLAWSGAFVSGLPFFERIGYWVLLMLLGWAAGVAVSRFYFRDEARPRAIWARVILASLTLGIPYSGVVAVTGVLAFHQHYSLAGLPELVAAVTTVSLIMVTLNVIVDRDPPVTAASDSPPRFLERLPLKLRGAEVWAVEAEDHYLRLHTSKGQDLILLRLADAIAELEGIEGAQTHRSWWVARAAITDAERGDGRATLTLKDGAQVPVSRTFARVLRQRGWF